jgi:hypothetical protein
MPANKPASSSVPDEQTVANQTDHDIAREIRDGNLSSPQRVGNFWLYDIRITGTGVAYRSAHDEYAFRDPTEWLTDEFVERCNGLAVVFEHPDGGALTSDDYRERAIGSIVMPYRKGDEVWGIARIYDEDAAALMQTSHISTSPGVITPPGNVPLELDDDTSVLDERLPIILDHIAIVPNGVWDKGAAPSGVRVDTAPPGHSAITTETDAMADDKPEDVARDDAADLKERLDAAEKCRADAEKERDELREKMDAMSKRMDAWEADKARDDAARDDASKKDESEEAKPEDVKATEKPIREDRKDEQVDANKGAAINDAADVVKMREEIDRLRNQMATLSREPTFDEREQIAAAHRRADSVYQMLGMRAPEAMAGENPLAYRRRLAAKLQKHSAKFGSFRLDASIDVNAFDLIESQIYADAEKAARAPDNMPAGRLIPHTTTELGKQVTRFYGDSAAAYAAFMPPVRNAIAGFDKQSGKAR